MRKILAILVALIMILVAFGMVGGNAAAMGGKKAECTTIQDGILEYSTGHYLEGEKLEIGYDPYGYNYQAYMFKGSYANVYLGRDGFPAYEGDDEAYLKRLYDEDYIEAATKEYDDVQLSGGFEASHFDDLWDLTSGDLTLSFTYDANGLVDQETSQWQDHAWAELGVREVGAGNFNPGGSSGGKGVWLATDHDEWQSLNTFDPDPPGLPTLDLDDKLILQRTGGHGEGDYNLPSTPPNPWANHRIWWDRDGVDPWQNDETANTGGIYDIVITLHATSDTAGTAYMSLNGLDQGFETNNDWNTIELTPAGMTFTGDMKKMQVFYGIYGYGATHSVEFKNIEVQGYKVDTPYDTWYWPYRDVNLVMKWNDAWLSNMDRNDDGKLDRHHGHDSYKGSGAWETNHMMGSYVMEEVTYNWDSFTKIVAVPKDAYVLDGVWYSVEDVEIGPEIWGEFAIIQDIYNDEGTGEEGNVYKSKGPVGFGYFQP